MKDRITKANKIANRVSDVSRRDILDWLEIEGVVLNGRLTESKFLGRVVNLEELPSLDERCANMLEDVVRHADYNNDYEFGWILADRRLDWRHCDDERFLTFLCEMVHPLVRPDGEEARKLVGVFNEILEFDGFEIVELRRRFGGVEWTYRRKADVTRQLLEGVSKQARDLSLDEVDKQLQRIQAALPGDPSLAIGQAKEMVESVCKAILESRGQPYGERDDVGDLVTAVRKQLQLLPEQIEQERKGIESIKKVLGSLGAIAQAIPELRNDYGTGHGKSPNRGGLQPRHARLVVAAAATLCEFFIETHQYKPANPSPPT